MRNKILAVALTAVLAAALAAAPSHAAKKKKKKKKLPVTLTVGTDAAGDWGSAVEPQLAPVGAEAGQDLTKATITKKGSTLNFIIQVAKLPAAGGVPEASRYNWDMMVDNQQRQLTGAFTEYLRGICNPLYNPMICPPPRDPGSAPFFIRTGSCLVGEPCEEIGLVHATFDPAKGTITAPVPMKLLGAKPGSKITPGASSFGPSVYAAPAAMVSNTAAPSDVLTITKTYQVPR
jgi:hypothetical protein